MPRLHKELRHCTDVTPHAGVVQVQEPMASWCGPASRLRIPTETVFRSVVCGAAEQSRGVHVVSRAAGGL